MNKQRNAWWRRGFAGRWTGLLVALVVGVGFLAVIGWSVLKSPTPSSANGAEQTPPGENAGSGATGLLDTPEVTGGISTIENIGRMYLEMTAKDDPNTLVGVIEADKVEPIDANERAVEKPRAWFYFEDGNFGRMDADTGRFFMPDPQSSPESGLLEGNVMLRVYGPTADGSPPIIEGANAVEPIGTATFDEALRFDFRRSRIASAGRFVLETASIELAGTNLTAVFNEVQRRLELIEIREGESITVRPSVALVEDEEASATDTQGNAAGTDRVASSPEGTTSETSSTPAADSVEVFYQLTFLDGIDVQQSSRRLRGDQMDLWMRLVDNELTPDAIATIRMAAEPGRESDSSAAARNTAGPTPGVSAESQPETDDAIVMRWTGPMRLQPLGAERPEALRENEVALRMTAERSGLVNFADELAAAEASAVALEYGFTTADLTLSGPGGNVALRLEEANELEASRVLASLDTGQIHVRGPGVLRAADLGDSTEAADDKAEARTTLRWNEQADFAFATVPDDAAPSGVAVLGRLDSAVLDGNIEAANGSARLEGDRLFARFGTSGEGTTLLEQLEVENGRAEDATGGFLAGERMTVAFAPGTEGNDLDPVQLEAFGNVSAGREGSTMQAAVLVAELGRDFNGDIRLERLDAEGAVDFKGEDGLALTTETLELDTLAESVIVRGTESSIAYRGAVIRGDDITLSQRDRLARVNGAGSLTQTLEATDDRGAGTVSAAWAESMLFDDYRGTIESVGAVEVVATIGEREVDTIKAGRISMRLSPFEESSPENADPMRRLLFATAYATEDATGTPIPASVESRIFATDERQVVEQLVYLEGLRIDADNATGELLVPSAGKLLMLDRRTRADEADTKPQPAGDDALLSELATGGPGLTRFEWRGGMALNRTDGTVNLKRAVKVTHKSLISGETYELHAERLDAVVLEASDQADETGEAVASRAELVRAEASGAVYFGSRERELIADRLLYDAENGVVIGTAAPGNLVTLFDATRGVPVTSRAIRWDLDGDVISIESPGAIVTPVGP